MSLPTLNELKDHQAIRTEPTSEEETIIHIEDLSLWYKDFQALYNSSINIPKNQVTALIGASGCGKSTLLRCINRMNDLISTATIKGKLHYEGVDLYDPNVDPIEVRRRIGMVFQKANPFPRVYTKMLLLGLK